MQLFRALKLVAVAAVATVAVSAGSADSADDGRWDYEAAAVQGVYQPLVGDFAGDGADDVFWYAPGDAVDVLWVGHQGERGSDSFTRVRFEVNGTYVPLVGDFVGDDYDDIFWYRPGSGADALWRSVDGDAVFADTPAPSVRGTYRPAVLHDRRAGDHKDGIVWQRTDTGPDAVWRYAGDGSGTYGSEEVDLRSDVTVVPGDWDGDGLDDLLLYGVGSIPDATWTTGSERGFTPHDATIVGDYQPVTIVGADRDSLFLFGSGATVDRWLTSDGTTFTSQPLDDFPTEGTAYGADARGFAFVHSTTPGTREDGFVVDGGRGRRFKLSESHDVGEGIRPVTGDFDDDGMVDVLWNGPGALPDELWYAESPLVD